MKGNSSEAGNRLKNAKQAVSFMVANNAGKRAVFVVYLLPVCYHCKNRRNS
jgi:hypothetical protein